MKKIISTLHCLCIFSLLTLVSHGSKADLKLTVQPIVLQQEGDKPSSAKSRIDLTRINRAYSAAGITVTFLPPLTLKSTDGYKGVLKPEAYVPLAISKGLAIKASDNIVDLFFVNNVPVTGANVGGLALTPGDIAFIAQREVKGTGNKAAEDAFAIGHELAHNLGLNHTNQVDNTIMGNGGSFEERTSAKTAFNANQRAIVRRSKLLAKIPVSK